MTKQQYEDMIRKALIMFAEALANPKEVTPDLVNSWAIALTASGVTEESQMRDGVKGVVSNCTFFPAPADFVKFAKGNTVADEELAWQGVLRLVRRLGPYATWLATDVKGDGAALWAAVNVGIGVLCNMTDETRPFRRQEFGRLYQATTREGLTLARVPGEAERQNLMAGATEFTPAMIGRPDIPPALVSSMMAQLALEGREGNNEEKTSN